MFLIEYFGRIRYFILFLKFICESDLLCYVKRLDIPFIGINPKSMKINHVTKWIIFSFFVFNSMKRYSYCMCSSWRLGVKSRGSVCLSVCLWRLGVKWVVSRFRLFVYVLFIWLTVCLFSLCAFHQFVALTRPFWFRPTLMRLKFINGQLLLPPPPPPLLHLLLLLLSPSTTSTILLFLLLLLSCVQL